MTGTVIAADGLIEIETPAGRFKCVESSDHIWSIGDTASLVISADLIRLSTSAVNDTNEMACRFISEEFVGSIVTVLAETPDGADFRIQLQNENYQNSISMSGRRYLCAGTVTMRICSATRSDCGIRV